jgi:rhodanese-related sulfurtransferase
MAVNVPIKFLKKSVNPLTMKLAMTLNENFVEDVKKKFKATDTIFVMCRSGARSAASVNLLAKAGFKNVYNIIDGFEGGTINIPGSYQNGKRLINGWKNSGAPWTYALERSLVYRP